MNTTIKETWENYLTAHFAHRLDMKALYLLLYPDDCEEFFKAVDTLCSDYTPDETLAKIKVAAINYLKEYKTDAAQPIYVPNVPSTPTIQNPYPWTMPVVYCGTTTQQINE